MERKILGKRLASSDPGDELNPGDEFKNGDDFKNGDGFKEGDSVEINLENAWFPAKLLRLKKRGEKAVVYMDSGIKTTVDLSTIRPVPPFECFRKFQIHEIVDVFSDLGWREGILLSVERGSYLVYLRYSGNKLEVTKSNLRLHRDWSRGWNPILKVEHKVRLRCSLSMSESAFRDGENIEFTVDDKLLRGRWICGRIFRSPAGMVIEATFASKLVKKAVADLRPVPPPEPDRGFIVNTNVEALFDHAWWKGIVMSAAEERDSYSVYIPASKEWNVFCKSELRLQRQWSNSVWSPPFPEPAVFISDHLIPGLYWATGQTASLCTKSLVPGKRVYGEKVLHFEGEEYRVWNPRISKFSAVLSLGVDLSWLVPGMTLLYLGAGSGKDVSHIAEIIGLTGKVYAVDITRRGLGTQTTLESRALSRQSVVPIIADARDPSTYEARVGAVDAICTDLDDPDELFLLFKNVERCLKVYGHFLTFVMDIDVEGKQKYLSRKLLFCEEPVPLVAYAPGYVALHGVFYDDRDRLM